MKNIKSNPAHEYEVLFPLVNLLLFDSSDSLDFESNYEKLSDNFIEAINTTNPTEIEDNFFTKRVYFYLKELSPKGREHLFNVIFNNDIFISTLTIGNLLENGLLPDEKNTLSIQNKILIDLLNYREEAKFSRSLVMYFILQFEFIFYYEFSDSKIISKIEYNNIIDRLGSFKEPTFK
ncbi:hypothetical protein [Flavobacterium cyclinae]|uniref:hypothetical protein n=1 Tax=Flavobacterium cyclinae TaxID=2895947 RepID=UPI001E3ACD5B|nr:hypothetical protein [Flavobacterium cyclinae]UGS21827.1 hypothetical protein LOS86_04160 [Flavobacterium cyclinae]